MYKEEDGEENPCLFSHKEMVNHVVNALCNLCQLIKPRQKEAALVGVILLLKRVVNNISPLKQFVLPILFDFVHRSKTCHKLLWQ
jgi:hypothetical protein